MVISIPKSVKEAFEWSYENRTIYFWNDIENNACMYLCSKVHEHNNSILMDLIPCDVGNRGDELIIDTTSKFTADAILVRDTHKFMGQLVNENTKLINSDYSKEFVSFDHIEFLQAKISPYYSLFS